MPFGLDLTLLLKQLFKKVKRACKSSLTRLYELCTAL